MSLCVVYYFPPRCFLWSARVRHKDDGSFPPQGCLPLCPLVGGQRPRIPLFALLPKQGVRSHLCRLLSFAVSSRTLRCLFPSFYMCESPSINSLFPLWDDLTPRVPLPLLFSKVAVPPHRAFTHDHTMCVPRSTRLPTWSSSSHRSVARTLLLGSSRLNPPRRVNLCFAVSLRNNQLGGVS